MTIPRVAIVCRLLWDGGVQRVAIAQAQALSALGYPCDLIFLRKTPDSTFALPPSTRILFEHSPKVGSFLHPLSQVLTRFYGGHRGKDATVDLDLLWRARKLGLEYDVVVYHDQFAGMIGMYGRLFHGRGYILFFHEFYPQVAKDWAHRALFPVVFLFDCVSLILAPKICVISESNRRRVSSILGGRVFLARNGMAPARIDRDGLARKNRHQVVSVTLWDSGRHPEFYVEVAKACPEFTFMLAGRWLDPSLQKQAELVSRSVPNLRITGALSEEELGALYRDSMVFLGFGYSEQGPGMGSLEALSHGCVVVTNRGLGVSEIIEKGKNGFVVESLNAESVAATLREIDRMPTEVLLRMSAAALDTCSEYSWERHVTAIERAVQDMGILTSEREGGNAGRQPGEPAREGVLPKA